MKRKRTLIEADMICTLPSIASDQRKAVRHFPSLRPFLRRVRKLDDGALAELVLSLPGRTARDQHAAALVELEGVRRYMVANGLDTLAPPQTRHPPWGKVEEIAGLDEDELAAYLSGLGDASLDRLEASLLAMAARPQPSPPVTPMSNAPVPAAAAATAKPPTT